MNRFSPPLASQWVSDAAWLAMDTSARGFHAQLMLFAAQREPAGTLPDDDALWRRVVGIPEADDSGDLIETDAQIATEMQKSLATGAQMGVPDALILALHPRARHWRENQGNWLEHLWQTRWKPMLLEAWPKVTDDVIAQWPHLSQAKGQRYSPLSMKLAHLPNETVSPLPPVGSAPLQAGELASPKVRAIGTGKRRGRTSQDSQLQDLLAATPRLDPLLDPAYVLTCLNTPPLTTQRPGIWDLGLRVLEHSSAKEATKRAYLGRLIKEYGEVAVGAALGEVLVKAVAPAEVKSFLLGVLKTKRDGTKSEQQARSQRERIVL